MSVRLPSLGLRLPPRIKAFTPKKVNITQTMGPSALPNLSSTLAGVGKPMPVKKINVRNIGFGQ